MEIIPQRAFYLELCMFAARLAEQGKHALNCSLKVGNFAEFKEYGGQIFCNSAIENGLLGARLILNFLGIYIDKTGRKLISRPPAPRFQATEVWVESFKGGRLISVRELISILPVGLNSRDLKSHIIRILNYANSETMHMTKSLSKNPYGGIRVDSLYYTCWIAREQLLDHFYRKCICHPVPELLKPFDQSPYRDKRADFLI